MNPILLAAHRYYDGVLVSDDEVSGAAGTLRDVVLAPAAADAPPGTMPMAATAAAAAAGRQAAAGGGSGSGVLLSRAYGESQLYTQVGYVRGGERQCWARGRLEPVTHSGFGLVRCTMFVAIHQMVPGVCRCHAYGC